VRFVADDGEPVPLPSASQRRLLAALALAAGATVRAEHLSDLLDVSPGALRTTVSRLRSRLGGDVIRTDAVGYRVTCPVDATMFTDLLAEEPRLPDRLTALEDALALWDGEALDEFRHEPWAQAEASRLDELHGVAVDDRAELLIHRGRSGEAVATLEAHVTASPLRDRSRGLLIQALASSGRQADALRAYQEYRTFLAEETGTEPSALVQSIERRVAAGAGAPEDDRGSGAPTATPPDAGAPFALPLPGVLTRGAPRIGRRRELSWLQSELVNARPGALRTVLISGEAGIGKTTLLAAFARDQSGPGGCSVLYASCDDQAAVPLQPFRAIVASLVDHAPVEVLRAHCERWGGELQRIAPHLSSRVWAPPPVRADDATERHQLFEAVADLLRRTAAASPLIVMLDDMQWAEPTALLLLRHLARALVDVRVLVLVAFRDTGEPSAELRAALAELERGSARRVPLTGFDDAELSHLVTSIVDAEQGPATDVLEQLRDQTAGNPLYAGQLVRHLAEAGQIEVDGDVVRLADAFTGNAVPPSLLDVVWSRVRALGEVTHEVLRAASVLGVDFAEDTLVEMTDTGEEEVTASLDASVEAGILVDSDDPSGTLHFTHGLVAHALYSELRGSRRRRLHERAARVLEKSADVLPQVTVVQLARHWALAGDLSAAQRWATAAGDHAVDHLAPREAATWYETALEHATALQRPDAERADLMVRLGGAERRAGEPRSRDTLLAAADLARRAGASAVLVRAALANDRGFMRAGTVDAEQVAILEAAIAAVDRSDTTTYARLLASYAQELIHTPRTDLRHRVAREAIALIEASDDPTLLPNMISGLTYALWGPGTLPLRRDLTARAYEATLRIEDEPLQFWTSRAAYLVAIESADPLLARTSFDRLAAIATGLGEPRMRWIASVYQAFEATMQARLDDAEQHAGSMLELGTQIAEPDAFPLYAGQLFVIRSFAGRYEELLPLLEEVMHATPGFAPYRLAYGIACAAAGRLDEACAILRQGVEDGLSRIAVDYLWITTVIGYAVLTIELQDAEAAAQLHPMLLPFANEVAFNGATSQGPISAYLGKLASLLARHDEADDHLQRALATTKAFGWRYHEATTLVALALSCRRRTGGLDGAASAWLDEAEVIAGDRSLPNISRQVDAVRG
jgi:DNA-binding SARP family transcriptional activator/tetratricopeptide (TPR) repeat protein